jgi:hypothetical protein
MLVALQLYTAGNGVRGQQDVLQQQVRQRGGVDIFAARTWRTRRSSSSRQTSRQHCAALLLAMV